MAKKNTNTKATANGKFFEGIVELQALREKYLQLIKANHPDNGGSNEVCSEIISQYQTAFAKLKRNAKINGIADEKERKAAKKKWDATTDEKLREALWKVVNIPDINIEVVGSWIWIDGNTYGAKDTLKEYGYKWSGNRKKWHFCPYETNEWKRYGRNKESFNSIRARYGSEEIANEDTKVLN